MIEVAEFDPGEIGSDLENALEEGNDEEGEEGGEDATADGDGALGGEVPPRDGVGGGGGPRADEVKEDGEEKRGDADENACAEELGPASEMESGEYGDESADQAHDEEDGIGGFGEESAPEADEDGGVDAVVTAEEDGSGERGEGEREGEDPEFWVIEREEEMGGIVGEMGGSEDKFDEGEVEEEEEGEEGEAGIFG